MTELSGLLNLQMMMLLEIVIGWLLRKKNLITAEGEKVLTNLVINLILPCNIIHAFCIEFNRQILHDGFLVLAASLIIQIFCYFAGAICYRKAEKEEQAVLKYATICSNAGFLGNPVAEGMYGSMGLLLASIYLIPQRIVMWSAGVSCFAGDVRGKEVFRKVIKHPCIIAVFIGMILMVTQFQLPGVLDRTVTSIGNCNTAMTMLLIGTIMAGADVKSMVSKKTLYFSVIRLLLIPLIVFAGCAAAGVSGITLGLCVILAAMPAGSTTVILASQYECGRDFASNCVVFTTILSMVTIPLWSVAIAWLA